MTACSSTVDLVRVASRRLVRELGFMGESVAGADLPASAVHALIEIEAREGTSARELAEILRLEKSSVSRMLRKLIEAGAVEETPEERDGRVKRLRLTPQGRNRVADIHAFARAQVSGALARLDEGQSRSVLNGLNLYADALTVAPHDGRAGPPVRVVAGYRTGAVARITEMHAVYYARHWGLGRRFECVVSGGLSAFCERLDSPGNQIWLALRGDRIVGSAAVDGEDLGDGKAHLRWFIVDDGLRGGGVGRRLLGEATAFLDRAGFRETHLWTIDGLSAARRLYEAHGFACAEEWMGDQWGREVREQRFVRPGPRL